MHDHVQRAVGGDTSHRTARSTLCLLLHSNNAYTIVVLYVDKCEVVDPGRSARQSGFQVRIPSFWRVPCGASREWRARGVWAVSRPGRRGII